MPRGESGRIKVDCRIPPKVLHAPAARHRCTVPGRHPVPCARRAVPADDARRDGRARLGSVRRHPRHRRRVRRSPELRHGHRRPRCSRRRASASASSRSPTGTAPRRSRRSAGRTCSSASPPATWIRWSIATPRTDASAATTRTRRAAQGGLRPDRCVIVYAQRAREAFKRRADRHRRHRGVSLRRIAHFDYWSREGAALGAARRARPTCSCSATPSGRSSRSRIASRRGEPIDEITDLRGTAFVRHATPRWLRSRSIRRTSMRPGQLNPPVDPYAMEPEIARRRAAAAEAAAAPRPRRASVVVKFVRRVKAADRERSVIRMPASSRSSSDPVLYAHASRILHLESQPRQRARARAAPRRRRCVAQPAADSADDAGDGLRLRAAVQRACRIRATARPKIPAYEMIKFSVTIQRGCFGGCTFCSITEHEGRIIQNRSRGRRSCARSRRSATPCPASPASSRDLGGPTANMYRIACKSREIESGVPQAVVRVPRHLPEPRTPTTRR